MFAFSVSKDMKQKIKITITMISNERSTSKKVASPMKSMLVHK